MGVKFLGCEKSTAHESPIQSWKLIGPSVVAATKSGAVSPIVRVIVVSVIGRSGVGYAGFCWVTEDSTDAPHRERSHVTRRPRPGHQERPSDRPSHRATLRPTTHL